jgi:membrane-associated phospholipid phosphatase
VGWLYALLVGAGRLYWGKHWPSDIVGSFALCVAAAWLAWRLSPRVLAALGRLRRRRAVPAG